MTLPAQHSVCIITTRQKTDHDSTQVIGDFLWSLWELLRNAVVYYMRASSATGRYRTLPEGSRRAHRQLLRYAQLVDEVKSCQNKNNKDELSETQCWLCQCPARMPLVPCRPLHSGHKRQQAGTLTRLLLVQCCLLCRSGYCAGHLHH